MDPKYHQWIRFGISVLLIPFAIYVYTAFEHVNTSIAQMQQRVALIEQKMDLRGTVRDKQFSDMTTFLQDHEVRIRVLEHAKVVSSNGS